MFKKLIPTSQPIQNPSSPDLIGRSIFTANRHAKSDTLINYPVGRSLAGLLLDVRLALALTIESGFFHCLVACALNVSNPDVRGMLRSLA